MTGVQTCALPISNELVWAIIPLLTLAAMELARAFDMYREEYVEVGVFVIVIFVLIFIAYRYIFGVVQTSVTIPILGVVTDPRSFVLFGVLLILFLSVVSVAVLWTARTARLGTVWSSVIFFGIYSLAAAWGASGMRSPGGVELWLSDSRPSQADLLLASADDLSEFSLGHIDAQIGRAHV